MKQKKQGIFGFYYSEWKKSTLPKIKMKDEDIKKEIKLISEKKSRKSARERKAILFQAAQRGISL